MTPDMPLLLPAKKLKLNVPVKQPWNASVPVPTLMLLGAGIVGISNLPPGGFVDVERDRTRTCGKAA
jgi:hypothetical protein